MLPPVSTLPEPTLAVARPPRSTPRGTDDFESTLRRARTVEPTKPEAKPDTTPETSDASAGAIDAADDAPADGAPRAEGAEGSDDAARPGASDGAASGKGDAETTAANTGGRTAGAVNPARGATTAPIQPLPARSASAAPAPTTTASGDAGPVTPAPDAGILIDPAVTNQAAPSEAAADSAAIAPVVAAVVAPIAPREPGARSTVRTTAAPSAAPIASSATSSSTAPANEAPAPAPPQAGPAGEATATIEPRALPEPERSEGRAPAAARAEQVDLALRAERVTGRIALPAPTSAPNTVIATAAGGAEAATLADATRVLDEPTGDFGRRVVRGLHAMINQRGGSMTMRLQPPELGALRIQMDLRQATVTARFDASTVAARSMLEQSLPALRAALESQGLTVERLVVHVHHTPNGGGPTSGHADGDEAGGGRDEHDAGGGAARGRRDGASGERGDGLERFVFTDPTGRDGADELARGVDAA